MRAEQRIAISARNVAGQVRRREFRSGLADVVVCILLNASKPEKKGNTTVREYEFTVVIERDEDGRYIAICPGLQGCYTEGESVEEAMDLIRDAIQLHVQVRLANDEPIAVEVATDKVRVTI